jgi:hypothetical protein
MADKPNSYKDPYWTDLATQTGAKLGLPDGLLAAIVTKGERSNADQVSEAGARTPFQIIPATRKAAIDKFGIDPYLSPENAAEVAGLLLKDSLTRNKGNAAAAVAEYHGGTDRANWGPRTRSYVARVMGDQQQVQQTGLPAGSSTFQRALSKQTEGQMPANAIANIYQAYQSGQMSPEEKTQFEADVKGGLVMLPRGASLGGQAPSPTGAPDAIMLPADVADAYRLGKLSPQEKTDLENDIKAGVVKIPAGGSDLIPGGPGWVQPTEHVTAQQLQQQDQYNQQHPAPGIGDKLLGAGEAALTTATGVTGGTLGMIGGAGKQIASSILDGSFGTSQAADLVEKSAMEGAQALTYMPRTETGREYAQNVGDVMQQAIPVMPMTAEMGMLGQAVKNAAPAIQASTRMAAAPVIAGAGRAAEAVQSGAMKTVEAVKNAPGRAMEAVGLRDAAPTPTRGTMASGGSAGTDVSTMRQVAASELPVPVELTKGQSTRDFGQLRFEQEAAKNPELGAPIRERMEAQNKAVRQSFDSWIDETGSQAPDSRATGISVDKAIRAKAARDKVEIRTAYKEAEKAGETAQPVSTQSIVDALNESVSAESTAPVLGAAKKELIRLGGAEEGANGQLIAKDMTLGNTEQLRKFVNKTTGSDATNIKFAGDLKRAIDASTEGAGGQLYQRARGLRAKYADQYENHSVISDLLNNKRGTADRRVALEDVADRVLYRGSLDDMRFARKVLQTGGEDGMQAWKEIQGSALRDIRDAATKGVSRDSAGNEIISASGLDKAIKRLDNEGKLDYLFGKKGGEQLRAVNDLAKVMFTQPPGAVNTSNTASVLLAALDMAVSGSAGMPLPIMSGLKMLVKNVKDRKLRARIQDALGKKP